MVAERVTVVKPCRSLHLVSFLMFQGSGHTGTLPNRDSQHVSGTSK